MSELEGSQEERFKASITSEVLESVQDEVRGYLLALQKLSQNRPNISDDE